MTDIKNPTNTKVLNVGQIGTGYWGPNLLRNLNLNSRCHVKWVCDLSEERRQFVKGLYPAIQTTAELSDILSDPEVDAVIIASPAGTHYSIAMACLEAGKHILVEKPMATSVEEIEGISKLATQKGLVAMAAHTFIFNDAVGYLKKLIEKDELGEIRYIYSQRLNLGRIRSDVDALWNFAPHDVSIIQYLLGDPKPEKVSRHGMDFIQKGIDDVVFLHIEYPKKIMAHVHVSWLDPHKVRQITVVGSRKMVVYDDVSENKIMIYDKGIEPKAVLGQRMDFDQPRAMQFVHRSGDINIPKIDFREPLKVEIDHFLDCILEGIPCLTGPDHAREVIRILSSANK
ncbi:MAG: Gfo/Idh/MocA family oxidoreductase [Chthoniobacterales bacterium]